MKRLNYLLLTIVCVAVLFCVATVTASADVIDSGSCGTNVTYTLDIDGTLTISGTGAMQNGADSFPWNSSRKSIKRVIISDGVTSITDYAFAWCDSLYSISISNSVTSIGNFVFYYCSNLQSITIPDSVTNIGYNAFAFCDNLQSVTLPDSITRIESDTFENCNSLQSITLPDSVTNIGNYAFKSCINLQLVTIPCSVTNIGYGAFDDCSCLRCVIFNGTSEQWSNITIDSWNGELTVAGRYCLGDGYIADGNSILNQSKTSLWYHYSSEKIYTIPDGVKSIERNAFSNREYLSVVILPEGLKNIGISAFCNSNLSSIYMPSSVRLIEHKAFDNCNNLSDIYFGGTEEQFKLITIGNDNTYLKNATIHYNTKLIEIDGAVYTEGMKNLVAISNQKKGTFEIPSTVTTINSYAFSDCKKINQILIPESVNALGKATFSNCDGIEYIQLPNNITKLNDYVFCDCDNLQNIAIPDRTTCIGEYAFYDCDNLKTVNFNSCLITICNDAFIGCSSIEKLHLPKKLSEIGNNAFRGCINLSEIYFSDSLTTIGNNAFSENYMLTYISLPNSVSSLGESVFADCNNLEKVGLSEGALKKIPANTFNGCQQLSVMFIPKNIISFGDSAFYGCNNLSDIFYSGTEAEWNKISIVSSNAFVKSANFHFLHSHKITNWKIIIESGQHTEGMKISICSECSYETRASVSPKHSLKTAGEITPTYDKVGYTAGVYCNDCKKYISGHAEIPKLVPEFADSKDAKESGNDIISNNGITVAQLLSQAGKGAVIKTTDGKAVENAALIGTGMILTMADGSKKEIVVYGDVDGDGKISAADARLALRASVGLENFKEDSAKYKAAKRGSLDKLSAADARLILRASVGLEDPKSWIK